MSEYWEAELLERQALVRNNYTIYAGILVMWDSWDGNTPADNWDKDINDNIDDPTKVANAW